MSYHIISYHIISCHVMSCHIISYHIISYITSYHVSVQSYWPLRHRNYDGIKVDQEFSRWNRTNVRKCDENKPKSSYLRSSGLLRGERSFFTDVSARPIGPIGQHNLTMYSGSKLDQESYSRKVFFVIMQQPPSGPGPPHYHATAPQWAKASSLSRLHDHTQTHPTR